MKLLITYNPTAMSKLVLLDTKKETSDNYGQCSAADTILHASKALIDYPEIEEVVVVGSPKNFLEPFAMKLRDVIGVPVVSY